MAPYFRAFLPEVFHAFNKTIPLSMHHPRANHPFYFDEISQHETFSTRMQTHMPEHKFYKYLKTWQELMIVMIYYIQQWYSPQALTMSVYYLNFRGPFCKWPISKTKTQWIYCKWYFCNVLSTFYTHGDALHCFLPHMPEYTHSLSLSFSLYLSHPSPFAFSFSLSHSLQVTLSCVPLVHLSRWFPLFDSCSHFRWYTMP